MTSRSLARGPRVAAVARSCVIGLAGFVLLAGCGSGSDRTSSSSDGTGTGTVKEYSPPGDIPDDQVFVRFTPPSKQVTVKVPEGWAKSEAHGAVSFSDKLNTIRIESRPLARAPSVETVKADELPGLAQTLDHCKLQDVTTVDRSGGSAVLATYQADSPVNPVTGKVVQDAFERYAYWRSGSEVVLTLSGPVGADNVDPWRLVSDSLTWR